MTDQEQFGTQFALLIRNTLKEWFILSPLDLAYIRLVGRVIYALMDKDNRAEKDKDPVEFIVSAIQQIIDDGTCKQKDPYSIFIQAWLINDDLSVKQ